MTLKNGKQSGMTKVKYVKVKCIAEKPSIYLEKGKVYDAFRPLDDGRGLFWAIRIEDDDEPGFFAFPAKDFEIVED